MLKIIFVALLLFLSNLSHSEPSFLDEARKTQNELFQKLDREAEQRRIEFEERERNREPSDYEKSQSAQRSSNEVNDAACKKSQAESDCSQRIKKGKDSATTKVSSGVGKIEAVGDSQYRVICVSGTKRMLTRKDGRWLNLSLGGGYVGNYKGSQYDSMTINEVGTYLCNM